VHDVPAQAAGLAGPCMLLCLSLLIHSHPSAMGLPSNSGVCRPR